jgi:hypothetical protein
MVLFSVSDAGGGFFQYHLIVDNSGGSAALSGLLIVHGGSVFGLDDTSVIGAPQDVDGNPTADWSFNAPFPPFVDLLSYVSLDAAADVPVNGALGGFFFHSVVDPLSLSAGDFEVIGISSAPLGMQVPLGDAQFVPEPSSLTLLSLGALSLLAYGWRRRH